ncbi:N-acetyltransferase [Streptomyces vinaceus]|uniref:N-acetyltransferase n=1 Tax=Streptomyces vinaceus TaxID=1960 RepID=UPI0036CC2C45
MTETPALDLRHVRDVADVRQTIIDIHLEVRCQDFGLTAPFYSAERFGERLDGHASAAGWEAVIAYDQGEPAGFAYGVPLGPTSRWWTAMITPLPDGYAEESGRRTFALNEIVVRKNWRGTGAARRIHDELLSGRGEERVTLLVNPLPSDGKVPVLYEGWGYETIGQQQPFSDSPVFTAMTRSLRG